LAQPEKISAELLLERFDYALKASDPKPSREACEELATEIHSILVRQNREGNRRNNFDLERKYKGVVPLGEFKDASPLELQERRFWRFQQASSTLLDAIREVRKTAREIEENDGSCLWIDLGGEVSIYELEDLLLRACAVPTAGPPVAHRRREIWHGAARPIAELIRNALRDAGYRGRSNPADENSPVAIVGAEVVSLAYGAQITSSGYAAAMRKRNRSKKSEADFGKRYPGAARIKIS
jgi:hypothetical protein